MQKNTGLIGGEDMNRQEALDILWCIAAAYTQFDLQGEIGKKRVEV
jgi:hypothetical protein